MQPQPSENNPQPNATPQPATPAAPVVMPGSRPRLGLVIVCLLLAVAAGVSTVLYLMHRASKPAVSTKSYFTYSDQDMNKLKKLQSTNSMTVLQARKWQDKAYTLVQDHGTIDVEASKVYAYLAVAQMDAAALSYRAHRTFAGGLDLVSKDVLCAFYADSCASLSAEDNTYDKTLSDMVMAKVKQRIKADDAQTKPYTLKTGPDYWNGPAPQVGLSAGSFKPWALTSGSQFRAAPPPPAGSAEQQAQLAKVKQALASDTEAQKATVVKWAGGPGTKTPPGIWLTLADNYMQTTNVPLEMYLKVRAATAASMADAVIAVFDSKYTYQYKRPNMFDTSIVTVMPTPNHPSYPAGHATISWAAATVLSQFLPANSREWSRLAVEATDSRTLGGIHFPMDNAAGTTLGKKIGNQVLQKW